MRIKRLIACIGMAFLVTSCTTDKFGNNFFGFNRTSTMTDKGVQYLLGRGVPKDNEKALYYFSEAAEQGDPLAQNELGFMYAAGKGTPRDYKKAYYYYDLAAKHGLASAQYNLGLFCLHGYGVPVNKAQALEWFKLSANAGFEPAKVALARYSK